MINIVKAVVKQVSKRSLPFNRNYFCQKKADRQDPEDPIEKKVSLDSETEAEEAERARRSYIEEYEARFKNVESSKATLADL